MEKPRPQFSVALLLMTVAADAVVLALMFQVPLDVARPTLVSLVVLTSALTLVGLVYGQAMMRTFCLGAIVPLAMMLVFISVNLPEVVLSRSYVMSGGRPGTFFLLNAVPTVLGTGLLAAITLGYVGVGFRSLLERRREPRP